MSTRTTPNGRDRIDTSPAWSAPATEFGATLRRIRERTRLTQSDLARRADFDHSYVSRLEAGARMPTRDAVIRFAEALGADAQERRELLGAAGFCEIGRPADPVLDELAALLADPRVPDWRRQAIHGGLWTVREMARRATAEELGRP